jgi:hypothetical protein
VVVGGGGGGGGGGNGLGPVGCVLLRASQLLLQSDFLSLISW